MNKLVLRLVKFQIQGIQISKGHMSITLECTFGTKLRSGEGLLYLITCGTNILNDLRRQSEEVYDCWYPTQDVSRQEFYVIHIYDLLFHS